MTAHGESESEDCPTTNICPALNAKCVYKQLVLSGKFQHSSLIMGIVQMELDTGSFEWKKYFHVPRYVYRGSSVLPKCSGKRIRTGEMHDSCHGQPDTLTGNPTCARRTMTGASASISSLNYSVLRMASAASRNDSSLWIGGLSRNTTTSLWEEANVHH